MSLNLKFLLLLLILRSSSVFNFLNIQEILENAKAQVEEESEIKEVFITMQKIKMYKIIEKQIETFINQHGIFTII